MAVIQKRTDMRTADVSPGAGVETVIARVDGISTRRKDDRIELQGFCNVTPQAGMTGFTLRVRRGIDTTGTLVGEGNAEAIATAVGSGEDHSITAVDTPGEVASQSYVLTISAVAGAVLVSTGELSAEVNSD